MLGVTGATGGVGVVVAVRLAKLGQSQRLSGRDPGRALSIPWDGGGAGLFLW